MQKNRGKHHKDKAAVTRRGAIERMFVATAAVHTACRGGIDGPDPASVGYFTDPPVQGTQDIALMTVLGDGLIHPVAGATVRCGSATAMTDASGMARGFPVSGSAPVIFSADGCLTYASPLRRPDHELIRTAEFGGTLQELAEFHGRGIVSLPPPTVYVQYSPELWADPECRAAARAAEEEFRALFSAVTHPVSVTIGPGPAAGDLVVPFTVNPKLAPDEGGKGEGWADQGIVYKAYAQVRKLAYARNVTLVIHELIHAFFAVLHTLRPGLMNPPTMYQYLHIDPSLRADLITSAERTPATTFRSDAEVDPAALGVSGLSLRRLAADTETFMLDKCPIPPEFA